MPMHDWTKVPDGIYPAFHTWRQGAIANSLNNGVLPPGFYALPEQVTASVGPDIVTLEMPLPKPTPTGDGVRSLAASRPAVGVLERGTRTTRSRPRRRLAVRHVSGHKVVAVTELVSPGNKAKKSKFRQFVEKSVAVLDVGVHLLVVDPFPPTARDPNGIHTAIWTELTSPPRGRPQFALPPD